MASIRDCSTRLVLAKDSRVSRPVSQPGCNRHDTREHRYTESATDPIDRSQGFLEGTQQARAGKYRQGEGADRTKRVREEQQRGLRARAIDGRAGQYETENRAGARGPEKSGGHPERGRGQHTVGLPCALQQAIAKCHERPGQPVRHALGKQCNAERSEQHQCQQPAEGVDANRPGASHRGQGRDGGKRHRHACQQRQRAARKGAILPCEHERQHRQDARAEDGQRPTEECQS